MKVIADTLGVARSNLIEQSGTPRSKRGRRERKPTEFDTRFVEIIEAVENDVAGGT